MSTRKPKIEYYWTPVGFKTTKTADIDYRVNWRLVGANGEVMCGSNQGFRDKTDAQRSVLQVTHVFEGLTPVIPLDGALNVREVGPGRKPA
jgi:uncharacterized protein YegP (UPF0339 family)